MTVSKVEPNARHWEYFAVTAVIVVWVFMLSFKIGVGLIAGLAVFSLTRFVRQSFEKICHPKSERIQHKVLKWVFQILPIWFTTLVVAALVVLIALGFGNAVKFVVQTLLDQGPQLVDEAMANLFALVSSLPLGIRENLPDNPEELMKMARSSIGDSFGYLRNFGGASFYVFLQLVFALILGVSAGLIATRPRGLPLSDAWLGTMEQYVRCFTLLMGAQVYVSIWNTFCTAIFIYLILPFFDVVLPFRELLLMFTAIASLIPAAGNIMANSLILVLTIRFGPLVALGSVSYLFIIHKLEYFVNGYIIGRNVQASVPEMLIAIIVGETAFGLPGLITGPVTYAFLKVHWQKWRWV